MPTPNFLPELQALIPEAQRNALWAKHAPQRQATPTSLPTPPIAQKPAASPAPQASFAAETPKLQNGQILPYKPGPIQRLKDWFSKAGDVAEQVSAGTANTLRLPELVSMAFKPRGNELAGLSPGQQQSIRQAWSPEGLKLKPEDTPKISPLTAEIAQSVGSVMPYVMAGQVADPLVGGAVESLVGNVAPKVAGVAGKVAGQGATFASVAALQEALSSLSEPEKANLAKSLKRILGATGEGALFGAGEEFLGEPLRNLAARAVPLASKPGVAGALTRAATGAAASTAAGAPVIGLHYAETKSLPGAAQEAGFFAGMGLVSGALGGPAPYTERIRAYNEKMGYKAPEVKAEAPKVETVPEAVAPEKPAEVTGKAPEAAPVAEPSPVTTEAPGAVTEAPKEPWQMTRAQYEGTAAEAPADFAGSKHPEAVYHGSGTDAIEQFFTTSKDLGGNTGAKSARLGAFFSEDPSIAFTASYGFSPIGVFDSKRSATIYEARLNMRNPLEVNQLTERQVSELDRRMPGFKAAFDKAQAKGEMFGVVSFLSRYREPKPAVGNFSEWAAEHGIPATDVERLWKENAPAFQEWRKAFDEWTASEIEPAAARALQEMGYDGIVVNTVYDTINDSGPKKQYIVFRPEDIAISRKYPAVSHRQWVEWAVQNGKPVPPEVLADYPDLQTSAQATTPAEVAPDKATAPSTAQLDTAWTRDLKPGDSVSIKGRGGVFTVVEANKDPSLVTLKSEGGAELRVGRAALEPVKAAEVAAETPASKTTALAAPEGAYVSPSGAIAATQEAGQTAREAVAVLQGERKANDKLQSVTLPFVPEFLEQDVIPRTKAFLQDLHEIFTDLVHWVSPRTGVSEEGLNLVMKMKGNRDKALFILERTGRATRRKFDKMPEADRRAFIDRMKRGEAQPTPELQEIADYYRKLDDEAFKEIQKYRPSLPYRENHFRILWKVVPGEAEKKGFIGLFRRPLQGTKGFLKHATLADISEGIAKGGVPVSTNPQVLFELAQADAQKFISAQKMWEGMKEKGFVKFVRMGDASPEGFTRLNDSIARVYFPVEEGLVNAGEWYIERNMGRLLNNYLSTDLVRATAAGRGLMWWKNYRTSAELSFSPFHLIFESVEAIGSQQGLGILKIVNQGILQRNPKAFLSGLKDLITSPVAWRNLAATGGNVLRFVENKEEFLKTLKGQQFIKEFPQANEYLDDLFAGGGRLAMHEDYRLNTLKALVDNINSNNYIGATIRLLPAINEVAMRPLFEEYIPRLKLGLFFREYAQQIAENADAISRGEISREKLARQTWDRVENRFGEMNFDNLFWNRTLKTALQFAFRSVTWKLGNVRGFSSAIINQAKNFAEPLKFARDEAGRLEYRGKAPKLDPGMAWVLGMVTTTVALGSIIQYGFTGTWPQELKDYLFPKIGGTDDKGNDNRVSLPTYFKDAWHLWKNPPAYVKGSLSGFITNLREAWDNQDYYGNYIYDPEDPAYKKFVTAVAHTLGDSSYVYDPNDPTLRKIMGVVSWVVPMPFSFEQAKKMQEQGATPAQRYLGMAGFTKAPSDVIQTDFQKELLKAYLKQRGPHKPLTPKEQKQEQLKRDLRNKVKLGQATSQDLQGALAKGLVKSRGLRTFMKDSQYNSLQVMWKYLSKEERAKLLPLANPEELKQIQQVR